MLRIVFGGLLAGVLMYGSVMLHELGHLLTALALGHSAELHVAYVSWDMNSTTDLEELWIALPALFVSLALAALFLALGRRLRHSNGPLSNAVRMAAALNVGLITSYLSLPAPSGSEGSDFVNVVNYFEVPNVVRAIISVLGIAAYVYVASVFFRIVGPLPLDARSEVRSPALYSLHRVVTAVIVVAAVAAVALAEVDLILGNPLSTSIITILTLLGTTLIGLIGIRWRSSSLSRALVVSVVVPGVVGLVFIAIFAAFFNSAGIAVQLLLGVGFALIAVLFAARSDTAVRPTRAEAEPSVVSTVA